MNRQSSLFIVLMLISTITNAGCPNPYIPSQTTSNYMDVESISLNYYAEGSTACFVDIVKQYCGHNCKNGYRHRCEQSGSWKSLERCQKDEEKKAVEERNRWKKQEAGANMAQHDSDYKQPAPSVNQFEINDDLRPKPTDANTRDRNCNVLADQDSSRDLRMQNREKWMSLVESCE